ncbi:MAG: hypothetical protein QOD27_1946, partial [Microbacteriaceae bacterium]|nr:hypothetical protein [Microbacteriaceae bacterium]
IPALRDAKSIDEVIAIFGNTRNLGEQQ